MIVKKKMALTEEQLLVEGKNWTSHDFIEYYKQLYGVMTLDEFREFNMKIIKENFPK